MNTFDFIGRALPGLSTRYLTIQNPRILVTLVFLRFLFWPLFWACNVSDQEPWLPIFGDVTFFIILGLFGLSNGWVATCLMMEAGMYVPVHEREKANSLMSFCLCVGYTPARNGY
jgi:Nucleoside transporter